MESLKLISDIALKLVSSENFDSKINGVLSIAGDYLQVSRVYIFIDNKDENTTTNTHEWCNNGITPQKEFLKDFPYSSIPSWRKILLRDGRIFSENIKDLPDDLIAALEPQGIKSITAFPVFIDKEVKGFIGFDECLRIRRWSPDELELLRLISGLVSNSFERNMAEEKLKNSEKNFRNFFETIDDLFIIGDIEGNILYTNSAVTRKLGYTVDELSTMNILNLHPADKRGEAEEIVNAMFRGETGSCPLSVQNKNGRIFPVETRVWLGRWDGKDCIFGISKDLSKEQEALQKFTKFFENNPAIMTISNVADRKITDVNSSFINKLGYRRDEVIGKSTAELGLFVEKAQQDEVRDKLNKTGQVRDMELLLRGKGGNIISGLYSGEIIENFGEKSYLSVIVDITEQVLLRKRVEEQRRRLENIIEGTHIGTWEWNIKTGETVFNERWGEIAGYNLSELEPVSINTWLALVHPEDLKMAQVKLKKHFSGEDEFYEFESRMKHKSGSWVWVLDRGKVIERDSKGEPVKMFGTHTDITYQKLMDEVLKEREKRFHLALEGTKAGLWDWDMVNDRVFYSSLWKTMLGYEESEIENSFNGWKNLWHPDDAQEIEKAISDYLSGKTQTYEITHRLRHKNGEWRWILTRGDILRDESGNPYRWVGTNLDVTDEKERSNELERFFSVNLDLLCIADVDGNFIKLNRAWTDILGYSREELEGRKFLDLIHPDDIEATLKAMSDLKAQDSVINFVNRYLDRNGDYHYIEWRSHPYGRLVYAAARDITGRVEYEERIKEISIRDPLTNIYNRRYIFQRLDGILSEHGRHDRIFSVSILDIDFFKRINDEHGHLAGDFILREFASIITGNLRSYDLFGRYGGEEFIIISMNSTREQSAASMERILNSVRNRVFSYNGVDIRFTFSAGISDSFEFDKVVITAESIIERADSRLYIAKGNGRNMIVIQG